MRDRHALRQSLSAIAHTIHPMSMSQTSKKTQIRETPAAGADPSSLPYWRQFLEEPDGGYSLTRLILLVWSFVALAMWVWMSLKKDHLQPIDPAVATILGILMGGKTLQRFAENGPSVLPPISGAPTPPAGGTGLPNIPPKTPGS